MCRYCTEMMMETLDDMAAGRPLPTEEQIAYDLNLMVEAAVRAKQDDPIATSALDLGRFNRELSTASRYFWRDMGLRDGAIERMTGIAPALLPPQQVAELQGTFQDAIFYREIARRMNGLY